MLQDSSFRGRLGGIAFRKTCLYGSRMALALALACGGVGWVSS